MYLQRIVIILLSAALTSCMVGPDFRHPSSPPVKHYVTPPPTHTVSTASIGQAGKSQFFMMGQDIPNQWWYLFHSSVLNHLIDQGLRENPTLTAASAALIEAKENFNAEVGATLLPAVDAQLSAERQRLSPSSFGASGGPVTFNLYNASVSVAYTFDMFGAARRELESLCAQVDYNRYLLEAAYITLTSNIATTAIQIASLQTQIKTTHALIDLQEKQLAITKKQFRLGGVSGADVLSQENQLAQLTATLPPLQQNLMQSQHALAALTGNFPSENMTAIVNLDQFHLPTHLPVSVPSLLVRQRPDILASEALLHAASAQIGVATANLYPQLTLTGGYGWTSSAPGMLFKPITNIWNITGGALQPIFNGGALMAKKRAAIAAYTQAQAQYRLTVLLAFQNIADSLRALENDAKTLRAETRAEITAHRLYDLTKKQYALGGVSYLNLLIAERDYQKAKIIRIQAQASRYTDTVALFQALGGGWWNG